MTTRISWRNSSPKSGKWLSIMSYLKLRKLATSSTRKKSGKLSLQRSRGPTYPSNYDPKSKTRAFSLDCKMVRKEPLDMGVNSRDPSQPIPEPVDSRIAPYEAHTHFEKMVKQYDSPDEKLG